MIYCLMYPCLRISPGYRGAPNEPSHFKARATWKTTAKNIKLGLSRVFGKQLQRQVITLIRIGIKVFLARFLTTEVDP